MEANSTFAKNVVRAFVARRLAKHGVSFDDWRSAVRSPFSTRLQELLGEDAIINDASVGLPSSNFGAWALELPRVWSDPSIPPAKNGDTATPSCWIAANVRELFDDKKAVKVNDDFYGHEASARCTLLDPFTSESFTDLSFATRFHSLITERSLAYGLLAQLCNGNPHYPKAYCAFTAGSDQLEAKPLVRN